MLGLDEEANDRVAGGKLGVARDLAIREAQAMRATAPAESKDNQNASDSAQGSGTVAPNQKSSIMKRFALDASQSRHPKDGWMYIPVSCTFPFDAGPPDARQILQSNGGAGGHSAEGAAASSQLSKQRAIQR